VAEPALPAWIAGETIGRSGYACLLDADKCNVKLPISLDDYLRLPHVLVSYSGRSGIVDSTLQRIKRQRDVKASLTHFVALPAFLSGLEAIATLPTHAAHALAKGTNLQVCPPPIQIGMYDVKAVVRRDTSSDAGIQWLRSQIVACARQIF
jgi:LysR family transcriptional regulator, mexEF-oprN operon transcriptional activator